MSSHNSSCSQAVRKSCSSLTDCVNNIISSYRIIRRVYSRHFSRIHSVTGTNMLSDLGLLTFVELLDKCRLSFCNQWQTSSINISISELVISSLAINIG